MDILLYSKPKRICIKKNPYIFKAGLSNYFGFRLGINNTKS